MGLNGSGEEKRRGRPKNKESREIQRKREARPCISKKIVLKRKT
jgi:hypothetical protein